MSSRICRFNTEFGPQWGAVAAHPEESPSELARESETELREEIEHPGDLWITHLVSRPPEDHGQLYEDSIFAPLRLRDAELLAPVVPSKIVCVGRNYREHAQELGNDVPIEPLLFLKPPSSILAPGGTIRLPAISQRIDYEGELGVVLQRPCTDLADDEDVSPFIRGFVCVNDVTARDLQKSDAQWTRAKGFDTFCPVGPWLVDELPIAAGVGLTTRVNGEQRQSGSTRDFLFDIPFLIRYISRIMTLFPGDLIATGTPAGVGPLHSGDRVSVSIEGLGTLENICQS